MPVRCGESLTQTYFLGPRAEAVISPDDLTEHDAQIGVDDRRVDRDREPEQGEDDPVRKPQDHCGDDGLQSELAGDPAHAEMIHGGAHDRIGFFREPSGHAILGDENVRDADQIVERDAVERDAARLRVGPGLRRLAGERLARRLLHHEFHAVELLDAATSAPDGLGIPGHFPGDPPSTPPRTRDRLQEV